jgi:hypothetical protein
MEGSIMTVFEWAIEFCKKRGMLDAQAAGVVELVILEPECAGVRGNWGDSVDRYPAPLIALLEATICRCAVRWIDQNEPHAWFKPLFDGSVIFKE